MLPEGPWAPATPPPPPQPAAKNLTCVCPGRSVHFCHRDARGTCSWPEAQAGRLGC